MKGKSLKEEEIFTTSGRHFHLATTQRHWGRRELGKQVHYIFFFETICQVLNMATNQMFERKICPVMERIIFSKVGKNLRCCKNWEGNLCSSFFFSSILPNTSSSCIFILFIIFFLPESTLFYF